MNNTYRKKEKKLEAFEILIEKIIYIFIKFSTINFFIKSRNRLIKFLRKKTKIVFGSKKYYYKEILPL